MDLEFPVMKKAIVSPTALYHGTDKKIIDYSEEEREERLSGWKKAVEKSFGWAE